MSLSRSPLHSPREGETAHAFFYPPFSPEFTAPAGEKAPVLVESHGGPTASASSTLSLAVQYWTSRGIGVLDVNYRGSTGYGRPYRLRLKNNGASSTSTTASPAHAGWSKTETPTLTG